MNTRRKCNPSLKQVEKRYQSHEAAPRMRPDRACFGDGSINRYGERLDAGQGKAPRSEIEIIPIIGQIEGHYLLGEGAKTTKYEQLLPRLSDMEARGGCRGVLFLLNTLGGDVEGGLAIAELIAGMRTKSASLILGGGHSIGTVLAVATDRSFIAPTATITLHPVRYTGTVIGAPQSWRYLSGMQKRVLAFLSAHSRARQADLQALMLQNDDMAGDLGTILTGEEAVEVGLVDAVGGIGDALGWLMGN